MHHDVAVTKRPNEDSDPFVLNHPRAPKFKKFIGAIGWLDPAGDTVSSQHAVLIGGIQADDRLMIIDEHMGNMGQLIRGAIDLKDLYLVSEFWVDPTDKVLLMQLYDADGLSRYISLGTDPCGKEIFLNKSSTWKHFRDRNTVAAIMGVPPQVRQSLTGSLNTLASMSADGSLLVHTRCTHVQWVTGQPRPADLVNHPTFNALLYLIWASQREKTKHANSSLTRASARQYKNLVKG